MKIHSDLEFLLKIKYTNKKDEVSMFNFFKRKVLGIFNFAHDHLVIQSFDPGVGYDDIKNDPELDHLDDLDKLKLAIGYIFTQCNKANGNLTFSWQNAQGKDVASCFVFLGEHATEVRKLVEEYDKKFSRKCGDKQAINDEFMGDKLYQIKTESDIVIPPLKKDKNKENNG